MIQIPYTDIPSATVQCHAANLQTLADNSLACVWFGGTQEGMADISVWLSKHSKGAWSEPQQLTDDKTHSEQNPILFPTPNGELWLLHTAQISGRQDTARVKKRVSTDNGATWSESQNLFPDSFYEPSGIFVRQPVQVLPNGDWLLPIFRCIAAKGQRWMGESDTASVMRSTDQGKTWIEHPVPQSAGMVHMNVVQSPVSTELVAFFRSRFADFIYSASSTDGGLTWAVPKPTPLPNNNSSIQVIRLAQGVLKGKLAVVFNNISSKDATERRESLYDEIEDEIIESARTEPVEVRAQSPSSQRLAQTEQGLKREAFWGTPRAPMSIALSDDDGLTWHSIRDIETGDGYAMTNNSKDKSNRELSYPSIHETQDGAIHVAYTHHRQRIRHVVLDAGFFS